MQINFTGRNIEVTPALKTFTTEKLEKITNRFHNIHSIHMVFQVEKHVQTAEATVHINGTDLHAAAESDDMYTSIDKLMDILFTQVTKHKEKTADHR